MNIESVDYFIYLHFIIYIVSLISSCALHLPFTFLPVYKFLPFQGHRFPFSFHHPYWFSLDPSVRPLFPILMSISPHTT